MRFFYCFREKSILSIMQQNPVKAQDSSQYNIQISEEHKDFISKSGFECDSSHKQSQSQEKNDQFKMNVHSWVKDKYSHGESKKLTFKENLTKE